MTITKVAPVHLRNAIWWAVQNHDGTIISLCYWKEDAKKLAGQYEGAVIEEVVVNG